MVLYAIDIGCGKDKSMLARRIIPLSLDFSSLDSIEEPTKKIKPVGKMSKRTKSIISNMLITFKGF